MKNFILAFLVLNVSLVFAQQGNNFNLNLSEEESYSKKENVALYHDYVEKMDASALSWYITTPFEVPAISAKQDFIALSGSISYLNLSGKVSLEYRVKSGKKWSKWEAMVEDDHHNGIVPKLYFLPVYLSVNSELVQFKISANAESKYKLNKLDLRFYFPGNNVGVDTKKKEKSGAKSINCSCPLPSMEYRLDWCPSGNCPIDLTPSATIVTHLVVHHSAGSNTSPNWAATVRSIWDYHVNNRGWDDIGYNFLIDPNGVIYEGRGNDVSGAHFSCMNPGTMGVCLLGDYNLVGPTPEMINSLTELLGWKACDIDADPRDTSFFTTGAVDLINLCGHRDGNNIPASCTVTECPGNNVYAIMNNLRTSVYDYSQTCTLSPNYSNIVILEMGTSPVTVYEDEAVDLKVVFKNIGDADISENLAIDYQINNLSIGSTAFNSLAINQSLEQGLNYTFTASGNYNYCAYIDAASNEINTSNNSFCVNVEVLEKVDTSVTSIQDELEQSPFRVFPNPSQDIIWIEGELAIEQVVVHNALGQIMHETTSNSISLKDLSKGIYTLRILPKNGDFVQSVKVLKE